MITMSEASAAVRSARDDETGARALALAADVEGYVHRRLRTAGTTAVVRDELGDLTSATDEVVGDVVEILWIKRERWAGLPAEDQRRWTFGVARNLVARRIKTACAAHARTRARSPRSFTTTRPPSPTRG